MKVLVASRDTEIAKQIKEFVSEILNSQLKEIQVEKVLEKVLANLSKFKPDLLLFTYDVLFTNDGFRLPKLNVPFIVFGESFRKADDILKAGAFAFFTFPVDKEILGLSINRLLKKNMHVSNFVFQVKGEEVSIPVSKIQYVEAEDKGCYVYLKEANKKVYVPHSMKKILEELPFDFLKVHKTFLVRESAIAKLTSASGSRYILKLKNGKEIPVGRKYYQFLRIVLHNSN